RLEAEGLVQRVFDPKDRRVVLVQITEEGRQRYEHGMQARQKLEEELLRQFNQEECEQFASLLRRLLKMWA
ncbi:MAG TPA: MarR family transcriptional regulator, partial [Ktedonobacteraceae bacterium]|nr:MarR family transcriptional regulator [Ktedonobacteraceae bacterium]